MPQKRKHNGRDDDDDDTREKVKGAKADAGYYGSPPAPVLVQSSSIPCMNCAPTTTGPPRVFPPVVTLFPETVTRWSYITVTATPSPTSFSSTSSSSSSSSSSSTSAPPVTTPVLVAQPIQESASSTTSSSWPPGFTPTERPQREKDPEFDGPPPDRDRGSESQRRTLAIAMGTTFSLAVICSIVFCVWWYRRRRARRARKTQTVATGYPAYPRESQQPLAVRSMSQQGPDMTQTAIINEMMAAAYTAEQGYYESPRGSNVYPDEKSAADTHSTYSYASSRSSNYTLGQPPVTTSLHMPPQHPSRQFAFLNNPPPQPTQGEGYGDLLSFYARTSRALSGVFNRHPSVQELDGRERMRSEMPVHEMPMPEDGGLGIQMPRPAAVSRFSTTTGTRSVYSEGSEASLGEQVERTESVWRMGTGMGSESVRGSGIPLAQPPPAPAPVPEQGWFASVRGMI